MRYIVSILFTVLILSSSAWAGFTGPTSEYYITDGDMATLSVVQGQNVIRAWTLNDNQYPIAVTNTVRTYATYNSSTGSEYTLGGMPTGTTYSFQGDAGQSLDGATDAASRNWLVSFNDYGIYQFNREWKNPNLLFTLYNSPTGITYDMKSGNLWVASDDGIIGQYTLSGQLLTSFGYGSGRVGSLAWEPTTDTLWGVDNSSNELRQFSKDGTLIQAGYVNGLTGTNYWGGEFSMTSATVPVPAALWLLGSGLVGLVGLRRKFSK